MSGAPLTPALVETLDYVREEIARFGAAPTIREIARVRGLTATGAHKHIQRLVHSGHLVKLPAARRGLALPEDFPDLRGVPTERLRGELARRGLTLDALARPEPLAYRGRACAASRCSIAVQQGELFCRRHWHGLPVEMQKAIISSFYARDHDAYLEAVRTAIDHADAFPGIFSGPAS